MVALDVESVSASMIFWEMYIPGYSCQSWLHCIVSRYCQGTHGWISEELSTENPSTGYLKIGILNTWTWCNEFLCTGCRRIGSIGILNTGRWNIGNRSTGNRNIETSC